MKYDVGDTVILNDEGNTEFIVLLTKNSIDCNLFPKAFDYIVKKKLGNWKNGEYIRHVFEENISMAGMLNIIWLFV